jgi:polyketide biosynthesis acyl carrier protein
MSRAGVFELVHEVLAAFLPRLPRAEIAGHRDLAALGADSVDRVEIILALLDRLGLEEPLTSFSELADLDALVDFLTERAGG